MNNRENARANTGHSFSSCFYNIHGCARACAREHTPPTHTKLKPYDGDFLSFRESGTSVIWTPLCRQHREPSVQRTLKFTYQQLISGLSAFTRDPRPAHAGPATCKASSPCLRGGLITLCNCTYASSLRGSCSDLFPGT